MIKVGDLVTHFFYEYTLNTPLNLNIQIFILNDHRIIEYN